MGWSIGLFLGTGILIVILRLLLRSEIKKKYWLKHRSGKFLRDWFLWDFRESRGLLFWIYANLILTISAVISFAIGVIGDLCGFENLLFIQLVVFIVATLGAIWEMVFRVGWLPKRDTVYYKASGLITAILFSIILLFVCAIICYIAIMENFL
ncbi:MAG: hypothetical protein IJX49_06105 [Clostridia bacterium]|nr:hypothetical protein [Clostridia bacterium]